MCPLYLSPCAHFACLLVPTLPVSMRPLYLSPCAHSTVSMCPLYLSPCAHSTCLHVHTLPVSMRPLYMFPCAHSTCLHVPTLPVSMCPLYMSPNVHSTSYFCCSTFLMASSKVVWSTTRNYSIKRMLRACDWDKTKRMSRVTTTMRSRIWYDWDKTKRVLRLDNLTDIL